GEEGQLTLGFAGSATYSLLPYLVRELRAELPAVRFELRGELLTPPLAQALADRRVDVAFLRPPVQEETLDVRLLQRERLVAAIPEDHELALTSELPLGSLAGETFVTYPASGSVTRDLVLEACFDAGFRPRDVIEVAETSTLVSFVAAGLGVAVVPESVTALQIPGVVYRPLAGVERTIGLAIARRTGDDNPLIARVLAIATRMLADN
ncbi:LysR family substrate-binding domain-containing protein, partial [Kribbia dieselivorans]|uniref:LysR family substrate-binding domain-containing protein n=1 Tax=Kribbia dieselivorans TaxID=331526 RepID=UPI0008382BA6